MEQLLWVGCLESEEEFKRKAEKGYTLASAIVSQKNIVEGIEQATGYTFDSINGSVLRPYPQYADKVVKPVKWEGKNRSYHISVGYKNFKYINRVNCKNAMLHAADEWIKNRYNGGELTVFAYSMRSAPMATACRIKEKIPNAKIYLLITDLPQFMDLGQSRVKAFLKKIDGISIKKYQEKFDGFILYASKMAEFLGIPDGKWMLMEGSYNASDTVERGATAKAVMYSGSLNKQYGIDLLLDAFMEIEDREAELWLTGGGNAVDYIKQCAEKDPRIKFFGFLPTREDVLKLQARTKALINMRLPSEAASAYCFPSKLFEYMASGRPVLSFKLEGIPKEYMDYLIPIEEETKEAVKSAIENVLSFNESKILNMGAAAKEFIVAEKNSDAQSKRITEFCELKGEFTE